MKKILLAFSLLTLSTWLIGQTVTPSSSTFQTGDDIVVQFTGSTNPLDWVGIYNEGETPDPGNGGVASITWFYINGTQDNSNTTVIPSGTLTFSVALPPGNYQVMLLCCDGYTVMASNVFSVEGAAPSELYANNYPFVGGTVSFTYSGGPGNSTDWIGIYDENAVPGTDASITYQYVTGAAGELTFDINGVLAAGTYKAYFFCCDIYTVLASTTFTVYEMTQPSLAPVGILSQSGYNSFQFSGGTGSIYDWVGIYHQGDMPDPGNGGVGSMTYLYVPGPNGEVNFSPMPDSLIPGNFYDAHFFCCDGYNIIASYTNWTVELIGATGEKVIVPALFQVSTPAAEMVRLSFEEAVHGKISIINMTGQTVRNIPVVGEGSIDVNGLHEVAYVVRLQTGERAQSRKVVVN